MPGTVAGLVWSSYEISSTGRPRRPPFLLTSSFQIWMAISAGLPFADSPPVSAMPSPILIGSAARASNPPAPTSTITALMRAQPTSVLTCSRFIGPLSLRCPPGPAPSTAEIVLCHVRLGERFRHDRPGSSSEERRIGLGDPASRLVEGLEHPVTTFVVEQRGRRVVDDQLLDFTHEQRMVAAVVAMLDPSGDDHRGLGQHRDAGERFEGRREARDGLAGEVAAGRLLPLVQDADAKPPGTPQP